MPTANKVRKQIRNCSSRHATDEDKLVASYSDKLVYSNLVSNYANSFILLLWQIQLSFLNTCTNN